MDIREKMLSRIQKLLALSGNNPSAKEAEAAFLKAQKMMLDYKIEMEEITGTKRNSINIITAICEEGCNTPWSKTLARIFSKNFACMYYLNRNGKNSVTPAFFGDEDNALTCKGLYDYAVIWLNKTACNYATNMRNKEGIVKGVKQAFIVGFLKGLEDKFEEQTNLNNRYALAIIVPLEVKEAYNNLPLQRRTSSNRMNINSSEEAKQAGYNAGRSFGTDRLRSGANA